MKHTEVRTLVLSVDDRLTAQRIKELLTYMPKREEVVFMQ